MRIRLKMSNFVSPQFIIYKFFAGTKLQAGSKIYVIVCKKKCSNIIQEY